MKISGIDFPKPLLNALNEKQLVVFAGAGVSIPQPAGLPTFRKLAEAIAAGSGETLGKDEPEDRFLGRLAHKGQQVHVQAAQELRKNSPKPTGLHQDLLALYPRLGPSRLVTTNFDTLFEDAAKGSTEAQPEVFQAPALPLGSEFDGIVHIHGSIDKPQDMVLTDADFGRAYLTEGWARRFLVDLFRSSTVLFVGYGHNDTVMNYLARALPVEQTPSRFALTDESDGNRWQILGIEPVLFTKSDKHDYSALYAGVNGLSTYAKRGILGWRSVITDIARNAPSLDEEAYDLVGEALSDPARTRFFTNAASHTEWVQWLDGKGHLRSLFGTGTSPALEEQQRLLGFWLAGTFAKAHSDEMFNLIAKHGTQVHQEFWDILGVTFASHGDTPWEPQILGRWVSLLLATAPPKPSSHVLLWLGQRCIEGGLTESLLDVFRMMSSTKLLIIERLAIFEDTSDPSTGAEVTQNHEHYELNELWQNGLKPKLEELAELLLDQLVDSFTARHRTLLAWQAAEQNWDPDSSGRYAIEPHDQDNHPMSIDVLIDVARDILEYLANAQPEIATNWCDRNIRSSAPILRRLAVHTMALREDLPPRAKIDWILDKTSLHDRPARYELFKAMRAIYPHATPDQRKAVIEEVSNFALPEREGIDIARIIAYEHFNWLTWLGGSDPGCNLVKQQVESLLEQYPDFEPRKWPALTHYIATGSVRHRSPWNTDELLSSPASEWVGKLLAFRGTDGFGDEREDRTSLAHAVEEAATKEFSWGIELADTLAEYETWDNDLWPPLIKSWAGQQGEKEQSKALNRLLQSNLHGPHANHVAQTLTTLVDKGAMSHNSGLLSKANQIAIAVWDNLDESEPVIPMQDWDKRAINHPSETLTLFWLLSMSSWYNQQNPRPGKISEEYAELFHKIVKEETTAGVLGRSVIARELRFVAAVDRDWTVANLIPLFDSENNECRQAAWEGLLLGGISLGLADAMEPVFFRALCDLNKLFGADSKPREMFIRTFTELAATFVDEPLDSWIPMFFAIGDAEDRRKFAWNLPHILRHMETDRKQDIWNRWLREYWENRLLGKPTLIDPSEAREMLHWLPELDTLFPEAVDLAIQMTNPQLEHSRILRRLNESGIGNSYPEAVAKVLIYLASHNLPLWAWHESKGLIDELIESNLPESLEEKLKEISAKIGL